MEQMTTVQLYFALRRGKLKMMPVVAWYAAMEGEHFCRNCFGIGRGLL